MRKLIVFVGLLALPAPAGAAVAAGHGFRLDGRKLSVYRTLDVAGRFTVRCGDNAGGDLQMGPFSESVSARAHLRRGLHRFSVRFRRDLSRSVNACVITDSSGVLYSRGRMTLRHGRRLHSCAAGPHERIIASDAEAVVLKARARDGAGWSSAWRGCLRDRGRPFAIEAGFNDSPTFERVLSLTLVGTHVAWGTYAQFDHTRGTVRDLDLRDPLRRTTELGPPLVADAVAVDADGDVAWRAVSDEEAHQEIGARPAGGDAALLDSATSGLGAPDIVDGGVFWTHDGEPRSAPL